MLCLFTVMLLYFIPFFIILVYHLYYWNFGVMSFEDTRVWISPYECGFLGTSVVENVFSYTYFILMVFFVVFDLEISLLINVPFQGVMYSNFFFYVCFIVLLALSYFVEVEKGYVSWNY
uniref:NADH-ubiquinone oxidoreductase chain 3 n=1 Tax=Posthodiplostomum centrarchi TaxID=1954244 RepID=A0A6J3YNK0_9TREM|nr:NADH dehydrogenase subunit 3 [Posthodiplostomum centrarchi]